ncbi:hypothetical protein CA13_53140 [Planctomycetes bacterium CA13]|uniref:Uncharacterized protein n=1 Tax=Novipirellula herctigrandis TaxID=2527986 RepID=A0A5C5ZAK8_9BACT|nr:hypothetical protein CA13_53140 [Planctomycetes bacterium CA13]
MSYAAEAAGMDVAKVVSQEFSPACTDSVQTAAFGVKVLLRIKSSEISGQMLFLTKKFCQGPLTFIGD